MFFIQLFLISTGAWAQSHLFTGKVLDKKSLLPVEFATVTLPDNALWAITAQDGSFRIAHIPEGKRVVTVRSVGYVTLTLTLDFSKEIKGMTLYMEEENLTLQDVVVTARKADDNMATAYTINRDALNHMQLQNVTDITQLLPGGKTNSAVTLLSATRFALRSGTSEEGNPSFGTAVEVDGIRLSNNSAAHAIEGIDTRNIGTANIASVEVVTGVMSVEHGDIAGGMVKIHTRKGVTPLQLELSSNINTKMIALNKGFVVGPGDGVMNISMEHARSVSDIASPYTAYQRNNLSLHYSHTLRKKSDAPLKLAASLSGNVGGYDSKEDPDAFLETFSREKDNTLRGSLSADWMLNNDWITNLSLTAGFMYADRLSTVKSNKSSSTSFAAIHGTQEGYFISTPYETDPDAPILVVPPGYWYQTAYEDDKPVHYSVKLKGDRAAALGRGIHKLKAGIDYTVSSNNGRGLYYDELQRAPDWREYRYAEIPALHNLAWYAEEQVSLPMQQGMLQLVAGLRSDNSFVHASDYGWVQSFSPRMNVKFRSSMRHDHFIRRYTLQAGWGKSVKLPSFAVLHPQPGYLDILTFASPTTADNTFIAAYYTKPVTRPYNPSLQWEATRQAEISITLETSLAEIQLSAYNKRTLNPYVTENNYEPFTFNMTSQQALEAITIPVEERSYLIDPTSGIVTVKDKRGILPDETVANYSRTRAINKSYYTNGSPLYRTGVEWIIDFKKSGLLNSSLRLDGNYYHYKGVDERVLQGTSSSAQLMANGEYYKYIGFYSGGTSVSNGKRTNEVNANITLTSHIPKLRLIISLRIESTLYSYSQSLSELGGVQRGFVLDDREDYLPSAMKDDIYSGDQYVGLYPDYYVSFDDMETKIPFKETFLWAEENDPELYNNLARLVIKSNYNYIFNPNYVSAYYSANINITKEIGNNASLSFHAKNFLNNMALVKDSRSEYERTLYNSGRIPSFYYGLTLRLKL